MANESVVISGYANSTELSNPNNTPKQRVMSSISPINEYTAPVVISVLPSSDIENTPTATETSILPANDLNFAMIEASITETPSSNNPQQGDMYFTGIANPCVTPVRKKSKNDNFLNVSMLTKHSKRLRSRSECSSPYAVPPKYTIRDRVKAKLTSSLTRRRALSETCAPTDEVKLGTNSNMQCLRIADDGFHSCGYPAQDLRFHKQSKFLNQENTGMISPVMIKDVAVSELEKNYPYNSTELESGLNPENTFYQTTHVLFDRTDAHTRDDCESSILKNLLQPICKDNCLKGLLARMNDHVNDCTGLQIIYDGLKIIKSTDCTVKVSLDSVVPPKTPLSILHIGKTRQMNIIPKKFDPNLPCVVDLSMENLSLLTIFPETLDSMSVYYPSECASTVPDENIFIITFIHTPEKMEIYNGVSSCSPKEMSDTISKVPTSTSVGSCSPTTNQSPKKQLPQSSSQSADSPQKLPDIVIENMSETKGLETMSITTDILTDTLP